MSQPPFARLLLFADGEVGLGVTRLLLAREPSHVVGVVITQRENAVRNFVAEAAPHLPILVWTSDDRVGLAGRIRDLRPNLLLLAWWPFLLREELACGQKVTLNMHPSLLPFGRGKDPNFWALAEGSPFGVTIHHVASGIDDGPIAFQRSIPYDWTDTGETLYIKAKETLLALLEDSYDALISLKIPSVPQNLSQGRTHRRAELDPASLIRLDQLTTPRTFLNVLRARTFEPHPGCRFEENGELYEVRVKISRIAGATSQ